MSEVTSGGEPYNGSDDAPRRGFFGKIMLFFREVIGELKKVVTPTRRELVKMTSVVLVFVVLVILMVTFLDWVFGIGAGYVFGGSSGV